MIKRERGITLIELLVVMTVIMVLASLIVASMKKNRENAMDVRTITALEQVRVIAEFIYSRDGKYDAICENDNKLGSVSELNDLQSEIDLNAGEGNLICYKDKSSDSKGYCVSVELKSGEYWCITGEGKSRKTSGSCIKARTDCL